MIKNEIQLGRAQERYDEIRKTIEDLEERYSGARLRIMKSGFVEELVERREEIREYKRLRQLDLEAAIQDLLSEKPMLLDSVNELLTKLRIAADVTQEEIAERLGWHQPNVSRFESENYGGQTISKVVEYAGSLGVWLYVAPSLSGIPPKITYQREEESTIMHTEGQGTADVGVPLWQTEDTSASITRVPEDWSLEPNEPRVHSTRREETYELVGV
jgi:transcriptional regulator with XRE-family HTH domain